ncbi:MAG: hypothetical protein V4520_18025 [Bacteroidota bacterium]
MNNNQNLSGVLAETEKLKDANIELELSLQKLVKAQEKLASGADKFSRAYQDNALELRKTENALKSNNEQIDKNIKMLDIGKASLEKNKALLASLKDQYAALTSSQGDNATGASKLNSQIALLGKTVEDQEKKLTKSREVFDAHKESVDALKSASEKLKTSNADFGPILESATGGFNAMKTGLLAVKSGFNSVGSAIKTTGFGLLVLVLQSLVEYFTTNSEGIKKFKALIAGAGVIVNGFKNGLATMGKILVDAFTHPVDSIKKLGNLLLENIINRFKAVLVIWEGVKNFDFKKISNGVLQAATDVTNLADKTVDAYEKSIIASENAEKINKKNHQNEKKRQEERIKMHKDAHQSQQSINTSRKPKSTKTGTPSGEQLMAAHAKNLTESIQTDKKAYEQELALLDDQLNKKLISQADYNKQSQTLQDRYHKGITTINEAFIKKDMTATLKQLKDVAEAEGKLKFDETNVKKAILPGQKLDAEKQLITDKYNYEIVLANGNAEKIKELEIKKQEALTAVTQQYEQQRKEFALNTAQQVADKAFSIIGNNIKASSDAKIKGLEKDKAGELSNKSLTQTQRKAIEDKYQKKEAQEKIKAFKAEQRMSVLQAVVNGALAVTKATAQTGILAPFVIPGIIASTALQIATIVAQKPPAFAKGGRFVSDGRGALLPGYSRTDNTNAYLRSGEAVVVSEAMRNPWARNLVSAINVAHGGRDFSAPNTGRGYAIGGIFTDGGNANRYYNQPVNDIKDMANTLAYQMINNFPPIYVDVKDVNNQQNILAQTVNRVNL